MMKKEKCRFFKGLRDVKNRAVELKNPKGRTPSKFTQEFIRKVKKNL